MRVENQELAAAVVDMPAKASLQQEHVDVLRQVLAEAGGGMSRGARAQLCAVTAPSESDCAQPLQVCSQSMKLKSLSTQVCIQPLLMYRHAQEGVALAATQHAICVQDAHAELDRQRRLRCAAQAELGDARRGCHSSQVTTVSCPS